MDLKVYIQSIFLCVVNVIFICAGTFLNLLVIVSFWRSSPHLRNKLCYFMIMVLSFCDFLVVITNHLLLILRAILWLKDKNHLLAMVQMYEYFTDMFIGFSLMAVVMCIERYLGAYYPFFHRTSLTRRRLLILIVVSFLLPIIFAMISVNDLVTSYAGIVWIFFLILFPSFFFLNDKLFMISRKVRREIVRRREVTRRHDNSSLPETSTLHVNLKNTSTCLLSVGCLFFTYFPSVFLHCV